jgi:hypothetical protein
MSGQVFNKKEISEILKKASEIQTQKDLYGDKEGLTKEELVALAKEVGIDQDSLLQAINQKNIPVFENKFNWFKGTDSVQEIQIFDGEVNQKNWDQIIREIRRTTGGIGETNIQGNTYEWMQRFKEIGTRHISLTTENGKTKVQYVFKWTGLKFMSGFFSAMFLFAFVFISLEGSGIAERLAMLFSFLAGGAGWYLNRLFLKPQFEKKKRTMHRVMEGLKTELANSVSTSHSIVIEEDAYSEESSSNTSKSALKS